MPKHSVRAQLSKSVTYSALHLHLHLWTLRSLGTLLILCPFAAYYLRYAVRLFFTLSRISLAEGKRAGQKVQSKIAAAVQKVKTPLLFVPLF